GLTKKIATLISKKLDTDLDEIIDEKDRSGAIGYMTSGRDAMQKKLTTIKYTHNPKDYDVIILGGPVWAWTVTPAVRTYLDRCIDALKTKKVAFFATQGSSGAEKKFEAMKEVLGAAPITTMIINGKDFRDETHELKVKEFVEKINK
ncbi:MAG: flavodoxin family protein, partial [Candidatus Woesearchaeota archaeon]